MSSVKPLTKREEKKIAYIVADSLKRIKEARLIEKKRVYAVLMYEGDQEGNRGDDFVRPRIARKKRSGWMNAHPHWLRNDAALAWRYLKAKEQELGITVLLQPFIHVGEGGSYVSPADVEDAADRFKVNEYDGFAIVLELK